MEMTSEKENEIASTKIKRNRPAIKGAMSSKLSRKFRTVSGKKVNTGVLIDAEIWQKFKIRCLQDGRREGETLEELISEHLKKIASTSNG